MNTKKPKELPNSKESEMMILGCMMNRAKDFKESVSDLCPEDFYGIENRLIFLALKNLYRKGQPADVHLICEELKECKKLDQVGGVPVVTKIAQAAPLASNLHEYIKNVQGKSLLRKMFNVAQKMEKESLAGIDEKALAEKYADALKEISEGAHKAVTILTMDERIQSLDENLVQYRGKKYLGLCQKTIPAIDENFLGLRKQILLAAAPNVGKTALTNQMSLDVLKNHEDACLVYFSLEMPSDDIFKRMHCNLAKMNWKTFVLGSSSHNRGEDPSAYFSKEEMESINASRKVLQKIGNRLQIFDSSQLLNLDSQKAISLINKVKEKTDAKRVIVVIDYLQVWPTRTGDKFISEIEIDKWRIEEIKRIRDAINDDPIIVISEARKPSSGGASWGSDLSDVMGTSRSTYTPDAVLLFSQIGPKEIAEWGEVKEKNSEESIEVFLKENNFAICKLKCPKARDGMNRFEVHLRFEYKKNIFRPISPEFFKIEFEGWKKEK